MMQKRFYLIRPSPKLQEKLLSYPADSPATLLRDPMLWSHDESSRPFPSEYLVWAKLLFLAHLLLEYPQLSELKEIFGAPTISLEQFDKWWLIEQYVSDGDFADVEHCLTPDILSYFVKTDMLTVDAWISHYQDKVRESP